MIIVEGCDGSGKSTLVKRLCENLGLVEGGDRWANRDELYKATRRNTYNGLAEAVGGYTEPRVWDRLYFSELVYAPIMDRAIQFFDFERRYIEGIMQVMDCPVIYCCPPLAVVEENLKGTHQLELVDENLERLYHRYRRLMLQQTKVRVIAYDYTSTQVTRDYENTLQACKRYLSKREVRAKW